MKFKVEFEMDNAAFEAQVNNIETSEILARLAEKIACGETLVEEESKGSLRDSNGNTVGSWRVVS